MSDWFVLVKILQKIELEKFLTITFKYKMLCKIRSKIKQTGIPYHISSQLINFSKAA